MLLMLNIHICGPNVLHLNNGTWLSNGPFKMYQKGLGELKNYNAYQNFQVSQLTTWLLTIDKLYTFLRITDVLINFLILELRWLDGIDNARCGKLDRSKHTNLVVYGNFLNVTCKISFKWCWKLWKHCQGLGKRICDYQTRHITPLMGMYCIVSSTSTQRRFMPVLFIFLTVPRTTVFGSCNKLHQSTALLVWWYSWLTTKPKKLW